MKVKEFIKSFRLEDMDKQIIFSSDEELNCLRSGGEVAEYDEKTLVIYGFDGTEMYN